MMVLSFRSKEDKEKMLEKAKKMEAYAAEVVDCLEEALEEDYRYGERSSYRRDEDERQYRMNSRYGYRGR